ncbi:hypothetical protein Ddye_012190, partial [Dipteronia dyeriana]
FSSHNTEMAPNLDEDNSLFNFVVQDGYGVKDMVDLGLSKVPVPYVQPPKERIDKQTPACVRCNPLAYRSLTGYNTTMWRKRLLGLPQL